MRFTWHNILTSLRINGNLLTWSASIKFSRSNFAIVTIFATAVVVPDVGIIMASESQERGMSYNTAFKIKEKKRKEKKKSEGSVEGLRA